MPTDDGPTRVAIACQGGGSHTAFTAGALTQVLQADRDYEIVGLSGTSGGGVCALLGWYGLLHDDHDPSDLLLDFWADLAARNPADRMGNTAIQWGNAMRMAGFSIPELAPSQNPAAMWGQRELRDLLTTYVDFDAVETLAAGADLGLFVSAIEVLTGEFTVFRETEMSPEAILASAAEPNLFDAVRIDGKIYWDGLFSKNPPVQEFNVAPDIPDPDEIWILKINPQNRLRVPRSINGILDRRNELAGNLSLNADTKFIEQVNRWIEAGYLPERYTHTDIHRIRFRRKLDWTTKLDRSPEFLQRLVRDGREGAAEFLANR